MVGKVVVDPKVTSKLITLVSTEKLGEVIPCIYPLYAMTQAKLKSPRRIK